MDICNQPAAKREKTTLTPSYTIFTVWPEHRREHSFLWGCKTADLWWFDATIPSSVNSFPFLVSAGGNCSRQHGGRGKAAPRSLGRKVRTCTQNTRSDLLMHYSTHLDFTILIWRFNNCYTHVWQCLYNWAVWHGLLGIMDYARGVGRNNTITTFLCLLLNINGCYSSTQQHLDQLLICSVQSNSPSGKEMWSHIPRSWPKQMTLSSGWIPNSTIFLTVYRTVSSLWEATIMAIWQELHKNYKHLDFR